MKSILIIEDSDMIREEIGEILTDLGFKTHLAEDGDTGIKILKENNIDLVITDIFMPGTDGFGVCRWIRQAKKELPIIAISGGGNALQLDADSTQQMLETSELFGANALIEKPFTIKQLQDSVLDIIAP